MGAGVVQVLPLEVDFRPAQISCHLFCEVEQGRPSGVVSEEVGQLRLKLRVVFIEIVRFFQFIHGVHQGFGNILAAVDSESSF
ncbi:hypothetical protein SDC9_53702 [bioreactor metagenome]|uniref:Uncharacterized protein n=1 Tax=bioreactor metagenome TaxID=1076179 RepID=A0A644WTY7_9ZZZZ